MLRERISEAMKQALVSKDKVSLSTIRLIMAALKDRDIEARAKGNTDGIEEAAILQMLQSMIKQRQDSIAMYEKGGRADLAAEEAKEIEVVQAFLPKQLSAEETEQAIKDVVAEKGASSLKEMGMVMAALKEKYPGSIDFSKASQMVKAVLSSQ